MNGVDDSSGQGHCFLSAGISEENFQRAHSVSVVLLNFWKVSSAPGEMASDSIKIKATAIKSSKVDYALSGASHIIYFSH